MPADKLAECRGPGFFYVQAQPRPELSTDEFDSWYNTEHGPARLKLDLFTNGYRYKSRHLDPPVWLACYDVKKLSGLTEPSYTILREKRSSRERKVLSRMNFMDRRMYAPFSTKGVDTGSPAPVLLTVTMYVKDEHVDEVDRWYEEEHTDDLSKMPGWIRSRRFHLVSGDHERKGITEMLAVHEFEHSSGFDGPEHMFAKSRPWRFRIVDEVIEGKDNKIWDLYHTFKAEDYRKPAPLDEVNNVSRPVTGRTSFGSQWQIDGCKDAYAPLIVFSNSLLTDLHIWDATVVQLMVAFPHFRFLRYNTRGYESPSNDAITISTLTDDLSNLLDAVGVEKCFAVIGVSLGGITCMNFAARHPSRLDRFVACDCNVASSAKNNEAWQRRVTLATSEGGWAKLADKTVARWFTARSVQAQTTATEAVKRMVLDASLHGFISCVDALCDYDLTEDIKHIQVPGLCVVGNEDGVLPSVMASFAQTIPRATLVEITGAGHLPMVEQVHRFINAIIASLGSI